MNNAQRLVCKLNHLLRTELGDSITRLPNFHWGWSEDTAYRHPMVAREPDGTPIYDYICQCGFNIQNDRHAESCSQVTVANLKYVARRLLDWSGYLDENWQAPIRNRWVLWRWKAPPPDSRWSEYEAAGIHPAYYKQGAYEPCSANGVTLCVPDSKPPTEDLTWFCINAYKHRLAHPPDTVGDAQRTQDRHQRQTRANLRDLLVEPFPMWHIPGRKDHVSFRQVAPNPNRRSILDP